MLPDVVADESSGADQLMHDASSSVWWLLLCLSPAVLTGVQEVTLRPLAVTQQAKKRTHDDVESLHDDVESLPAAAQLQPAAVRAAVR